MSQSKVITTAKGKALSQERLELTHSFKTQLKPLRAILYALHLDLYSDVSAAQSFADFLVHGVVHQGRGFLKLHKGLVTQGLRVLGLEEPCFQEGFFFKNKKYPYPYNAIFSELESLGKGAVVLVGHNHEKRDFDYVKRNRARVQSLLTLLNWPKYVKLRLSEESKQEILSEFRDTISGILDPSLGYRSVTELSSRLCETLFSRDDLKRHSWGERLSLDLSNRTYKGRSDIPGKIPRVLIDMVGANPFYADEGPQGRSTVISEPGGKHRIIVGYNGLLNATDFFERARQVLDRLKSDCSKDQSKGHTYLRVKLQDQSTWLKGSRPIIVSADLDAFTDNLSYLSVLPYLKRMNATDFQSISASPILVGDEEVYPTKFLMGLKGTFEVASIVHHGIIGSLTQDYVLCGDDIVFVTAEGESMWQDYASLCQGVGLRVNYSKTVRSTTVGVFCGEVYWCGEEITPLRIPVYTLKEGPDDRRVISKTAGEVISRAQALPTSFRKTFVGAVVRLVASHRLFRRRQIPKYLPAKLGGLGIFGSKGLLKLLESRALRSYVTFDLDRDEPVELITRRYVPWVFPSEVPRFPWCLNLLIKGGYSKPKRARSVRPCWDLKDIVEVLCYFYSMEVA